MKKVNKEVEKIIKNSLQIGDDLYSSYRKSKDEVTANRCLNAYRTALKAMIVKETNK